MSKKGAGAVMPRKELLEKLAAVAPALATNDLIPVMTHFCFYEGRVSAFNDQIAISAPLKMPLLTGTKFALSTPGATLLAMLKESKAKDTTFEIVNTDGLRIKAASTVLHLPFMPAKSHRELFEMPAPGTKNLISVAKWEEFLEGLAGCQRSFGIDASVPEQLGVTVIVDGDVLKLFSVNDSTLSHVRVKLKKDCKFKGRAILSADFCKQLLALGKKPPEHFEIGPEYALFVSASGVQLFGRLVECTHPTDFNKVLVDHLPKNAARAAVQVPSKLQGILARAVIIAGTIDAGAVSVKVTPGAETTRIHFFAKSSLGEVKDYLTIDTEHPEVSCSFDPKLLRAGAAEFDSMLFSEHVAVFMKKQAWYLVSAFGE